MYVNEQQLRAFRAPAGTQTWRPISHGIALDHIRAGMDKVGLKVAEVNGTPVQTFTVINDGARAFGTMDIAGRNINDDVGFMIGFINSTDRSKALRIAFGSRVFICSNGMVIADEVVGRKHTTFIMRDLPDLVDETMSRFDFYRNWQKDLFARLQDVELDNLAAHDIILRGARDHGVITGGEIIKVADEWAEPCHDAFKPRNAWSLLNAFTEVHKNKADRNGSTVAERQVSLANFMQNEFAADIKVAAEAQLAEMN